MGLSSLYTAVSGMSANGTALSVIGDNIANSNTVGFKGSTTNFGDVLSSSIGGSSQIGRGVLVSAVTPVFTQGSFQSTSSVLDLAIDGNGFFMVNDGAGTYYTRAGQFTVSKTGEIVNSDGLVLQGYQADTAGNITGTTGNLAVSAVSNPAQQTANAEVSVNINGGATANAGWTTPVAGGGTTLVNAAWYTSSTSTNIYDSQGGSHAVTIYFEKTADNTWNAHYVYENPLIAGELIEATAGSPQALTFNTNGSLLDDSSATPVTFDFGASVTTPQTVTFNYGQGTGEAVPGDGLGFTTQYAAAFAVNNMTQDGFSSGSLKNVTVNEQGIITGIFTNGQTRTIGQITLAKFVAPTALLKSGRNLYSESFKSGQALVGAAGNSGLGRTMSNTLELSNVDLAEEFVKMISSQRGFQANSKIITVTDELLNEVVNLKR